MKIYEVINIARDAGLYVAQGDAPWEAYAEVYTSQGGRLLAAWGGTEDGEGTLTPDGERPCCWHPSTPEGLAAALTQHHAGFAAAMVASGHVEEVKRWRPGWRPGDGEEVDNARRLAEAEEEYQAATQTYINARNRLERVRRELGVRESLPMMGEE